MKRLVYFVYQIGTPKINSASELFIGAEFGVTLQKLHVLSRKNFYDWILQFFHWPSLWGRPAIPKVRYSEGALFRSVYGRLFSFFIDITEGPTARAHCSFSDRYSITLDVIWHWLAYNLMLGNLIGLPRAKFTLQHNCYYIWGPSIKRMLLLNWQCICVRGRTIELVYLLILLVNIRVRTYGIMLLFSKGNKIKWNN